MSKFPNGAPDEASVFLNCPFDATYEKLFLAQIAALVSLSRTPRCALEVPEDGTGRLKRLIALITSCPVSLHDLSRVGSPARFNMPFELGLACAVAEQGGEQYAYVLLERVPNRLDKTLSDIKGRDPIIHRGSHVQLINGLVSAFSVKGRKIFPSAVHQVARQLFAAVEVHRRKQRIKSIFDRHMFEFAVAASAEIAEKAGLIR